MSQKHGNSVTNLISSLLWINIVIPNFKSHNIIMSARVYFMRSVKDCKAVSIMSPQDEQWRRTSLLLYTAIFLFYWVHNRMQSKHKQTKCERSRRNSQITAFSVDFTILNQRIIWKDYFEFVTEFPCLLGHPVYHSYFKVRPFDVTEFPMFIGTPVLCVQYLI